MNQVSLSVQPRGKGKQAVKKLRNQGLIPGVYYVKGSDAIPIVTQPLALRPLVYTSHSYMVNLSIEGEKEVRECFMKETIFDPVTEKIIHFDLVGVVSGQTITVEVPINFKGQPVGVREGGLLQHGIHKVKVDCLPKDLPDSIEVDISNLGIGKSIAVKNLNIEGVKFDVSPDTILVSVVHPRVIKEEAPTAAATAAAAATTAATATPVPAEKGKEKEKGKK